MLVVVASRHDPAAQRLVARWAASEARLLSCEDLSLPGWRHDLTLPEQRTAVVGGERVPCSEIAAVLTHRPCLLEAELMHIAGSDRGYVAAEMNAFLRSWLSCLRCPVVNRPTAAGLSGPAWRPEQWLMLAASLGIPLRMRHRQARWGWEPHADLLPTVAVTVVGRRWFGLVDAALGRQAVRLAQAAGVVLLCAFFDGPSAGARFCGATCRPSLDDPEIAEALLTFLKARA